MNECNPYIGLRPADQFTNVDWWLINVLPPDKARQLRRERIAALICVAAQKEPRP